MGTFTLKLNYSGARYNYIYKIPYSEFNDNNKTAEKSNTYTLIEESGLYCKKIDGNVYKLNTNIGIFNTNIDINPIKYSSYLYKSSNFDKLVIFNNDDIDNIVEIYMYLKIRNEYTGKEVTCKSNSIIINIPDSKYKLNDTPLNTLAATINYNILYDDSIGLDDNDKNNIKNIIDDLSFNMNDCGYNEYPNIKYIKKTDNFAGGLWGNVPVINVGDNNTYLDKTGNPIHFTSKKSTIFNGLTLLKTNALLNIEELYKYNNNSVIGIRIKYDKDSESTTFTLLGWSNNSTTNLYSKTFNNIKDNIIIEICGHGGTGGNGASGVNQMHYFQIDEYSTLVGGGGGGGGGYIAVLANMPKIQTLDIVRYHNGEIGWIDFKNNSAIIYDGGNGSNLNSGMGGNVIINSINNYYIISNISGGNGGTGGTQSIKGDDINYNIKYSDKYITYKNTYGGEKGENIAYDMIYCDTSGTPIRSNGRIQYKLVYSGGGGGGGSSLNSGGSGSSFNNKSSSPSYGGGGGGGCGALDYKYNDASGIISEIDSNLIYGITGGSWLIRVYAENLDGTPAKWE